MPNQLEAAREQYQTIVKTDPKIQTWYEFNTQELPRILRFAQDRRAIQNLIHAHIRYASGLDRRTELPDLSWIADNPAIVNITGGQFPLPVMFFTDTQTNLYEEVISPIPGDTDAISIGIFPETISRGELDSKASRDSRLIMIPPPSRSSLLSPTERLQHELVHGIDALVDARGVDLVIAEMVAVVGSYSDSDSRLNPVKMSPKRMSVYLYEQLASEGQKSIQVEEFEDRVNEINTLIYNMTHDYPKTPNDQVTRRLMACRSLDEVRQKYPDAFKPNPDVELYRFS